MNDVWLLIDSDYLCHRARWSMGDLAWQGKPTGVIYGFLQAVLQLQDRFNTNNIAFCFDSRYNKRKEIYPDYKTNRKNQKLLTQQEEKFDDEFYKQIILLRKVYLPKIGFRNIFMQTGLESDDLIAQLVKDIRDNDIVIVSADEDLFQCIRGNVSVFNPQKHLRMTFQRFYKTYKVVPKEWITIKALAGCPSDNIKGLPNIGTKTMLKFLRSKLKPSTKAYETLTSPIAKLTLHQNIPLVELPFDGIKKMKLREDHISKNGWRSVCKKLGFKSLIDRSPNRK